MSFSFGQATTTTGSTFGTATPSGSLFGGGDASKPFQAGAATDNKPSLFGSPASSTPGFGFSFGAKTTAAAPSLFSSPTPATANTTSAFGASKPLSFGGFTSPPVQTVGSPGFGQPQKPANATEQKPAFGMTTQQPTAFGTPTTQASSFGSPGGFSFSKPGGGMSFATPASGFAAPQPTTATSSAPQTTQSGFGQTTTASSLGFGQSAFASKPFSFGPGAATTTAAQPPAFGTTTATATQGLSFGQTTATQAQPSTQMTQPSSQAQPNFGFNQAQTQNQGFTQTSQPSFSAPQAQTSFVSQPQTTTSQPLSFAKPTTQFGTQSQFGVQPSQPAQTTAQSLSLSFGTTQSQPSFSTATSQPTLGQTSQPSVQFGGNIQTTQAQPLGQTSQPSQFTGTSQASFSTGQTGQTQGFGTTSLSFGTTPATTSLTTTSQAGFSFATTTSGSSFGTTTGLSFSKPLSTATAATSGTTSTTTPSGITALGKSTAAAMPTLGTTVTTTAAAPPAAITSLTFAQLQENINKWTLQLEEQQRTFINQATQLNAWDRLLISNGEKIVELNDAVETVKNEQQGLEHELDFVLAQQKELDELLAPMEKQLLQDAGDRMRDPEREHMYSLAETLDTQLRQMSEDLKEVIEHLNETNRSQDSNDPIVQIGRILNAHMSSMQWIDNSIAQISTKLDQLKATHDTLRRDNERSFQLTYN